MKQKKRKRNIFRPFYEISVQVLIRSKATEIDLMITNAGWVVGVWDDYALLTTSTNKI